MEASITKWSLFKELIKVRCNKPLAHPEFVFYFVLINLIFGALGVYVSIFSEMTKQGDFDLRALNGNIVTYYIAILAGGCFDLILSKAKFMKNTMALFSLSILIIGIGAVIISYVIIVQYALTLSTVFTLISLFVWWIANAENDKLMNDEVPADVTTGGDVTGKIMGDLTGFTH